MNRLNQVKGMTQMIQPNQSINLIYTYVDLFWEIFYFVGLFWKTFNFVDLFGKSSISLTFFGYFESIQLIQSYQSLKVKRLSHLFYENELTHSPINSIGKGNESVQSILRENALIQVSQLSRVDWYTSLIAVDCTYLGIRYHIML